VATSGPLTIRHNRVDECFALLSGIEIAAQSLWGLGWSSGLPKLPRLSGQFMEDPVECGLIDIQP